MQNTIKAMPSKVMNHVRTHKAAYVAGAVAVAAIALQQRNRKEFDKFLISKGIDLDEYYTPDETLAN
jgi:predicted patatin/cPLA2 family phospholipase